jgi:hypothetical protein
VATVLLTQTGVIPPSPSPSNWEQDGAFRTMCNWTKISFDDPIVYPGQPGAAHAHVFAGNTSIDAYTTVDNIRSRGNGSCRGGTINLSGYWAPAMIDTGTGKPIAPKSFLIYYKTGNCTYMVDCGGPVAGQTQQPLNIRPIPQGLRMLAGDASRASPGGVGRFSCMQTSGPDAGNARSGTVGSTIPTNCQGGDEIWMAVSFPQCWDGQNLDSPDHRSHMAYEIAGAFVAGKQWSCPATHPVVIPKITITVIYTVPANLVTSNWRLSSDVYSGPAGYSAHADWMNGWDPAISDVWGTECLAKRRDCGAETLGDGRMTGEFQGN